MICNYPFTAIAGQEKMKTALLLNAVDPTLSGVLLQGERGTAKSTAVRSLADLLPDRRIVELPVSATEDRLVGTLDLEKALEDHEKAVEPGLLAEADGNILYVDEVNLLADHLVDAILDAAASGVCTLERDGVRASFPTRFALVGSMNPEEGELRPQMLDRFGLSVAVESESDPSVRSEIVRRRLVFEQDPEGFCSQWEAAQAALSETLRAAQELLPAAELSDEMLSFAVELCLEAGAEGHRADLFTCKAARALAALDGRTVVTEDDIREGAAFALPHRTPKRPFEDAAPEEEPGSAQQNGTGSGQNEPMEGKAAPQETVSGNERELRDLLTEGPVRKPVREDPSRGRAVRTEAYRDGPVIASSFSFPGSLRKSLLRAPDANGTLLREDWQRIVRMSPVEHSILFCVDASASIGAKKRMAAVKTLILSLLNHAYQEREEVGLITFRGDHAEVILPFTKSTQTAKERLQSVPTGGRTPLAEGLALAEKELVHRRWKSPEKEPVLILVTDGRANAGANARARAKEAAERLAARNIKTLVFDPEQGPVRLGLAGSLADTLHAEYYPLDEIIKGEEK